MSYTRVIAFDQSPTKTGWAEYSVGAEIEYGICPAFRKPVAGERKEDHEVARLRHVLQFIKGRVTRPGVVPLVLMEGFAHNEKFHSHMMGGLGYSARFFLSQSNIDWLIVSPGSLKKFAASSGSAKKELMIKECLKRFHVDTDDNNVADAVALCHVGMALLGWWEPRTGQQREVVALLQKNNDRIVTAA